MLIRIAVLPVWLCLIFVQSISAQTISASGKIKDAKGSPIFSASVIVKDSKQGTSSDSLGVFHLKVKANDSLVFSGIGFSDTTVAVEHRSNFNIVLRPQVKALVDVVVSGAAQNTGLPPIDEIAREQIITSTFETYLRSAEFSNGTSVTSGFSSTSTPEAPKGSYFRATTFGQGATNTINAGTMLPVMAHKEDTKGSRYLLEKFVNGVIVDQNNKLIVDSSYFLNYDKIDGQLMMTQDAKNYLELDKDKIMAFAFKAKDSSYIFLNVPILSKVNYFFLIANGPKYSAYKAVRSKFVKSTYTSNGLVETGNNYDEYVDNQTYYWVDERNNKAGIFEMKRKSIKTTFAMEKDKTDEFFSKHKMDDIDDSFVRNLIRYLNQ